MTVAVKHGQAGGDGLLRIGAVIVGIMTFLAIFGPAIAPYDPTAATDNVSTPPPPLADWPRLFIAQFDPETPAPHWFGVDASGLDVFSRTISAPRTDLLIALTATACSFVVGATMGALAGFFRHWSTELLMRASDVLQSFPVFISAMILVALAGRSGVNIVLAMTLLYSPIFIRLTRAEVMSLRNRGFVEAARATGVRERDIVFRYVLPNALGPAAAQASVTIGFAILLTAGLSFVGAGVRPPTPEWGLMIANGASQIVLGDWWPSLFPGAAISITVFGFASLGHALERRYGQ